MNNVRYRAILKVINIEDKKQNRISLIYSRYSKKKTRLKLIKKLYEEVLK